jgi:hypothetical protein
MTGHDDPELARLLDAAVARLASVRYTFTEEEARGPVWEAWGEVSPQCDSRFVLAHEAGRDSPRHWRLEAHTLANNRLLEALESGAWDGRALEAELARLDAEAGGHHVFCPADPRFTFRDGAWEPTDREPDARLSPEAKASLDALGPRLLERWGAASGLPWTLRQIADALGELGWPDAKLRGGWLLVRTWLRGWPSVVRVGRDYWVMADRLPGKPRQTRLGVAPVFPTILAAAASAAQTPRADGGVDEPAPGVRDPEAARRDDRPIAEVAGPVVAHWTVTLRTVHLLEGFLPVPAEARAAYPSRPPGAGRWEAVRGKWFDSNTDLWLWLDRALERLSGPDLAEELGWCEAGLRLRITWTTDVVALRTAGTDSEAQREETRLVDREALAELRGGVGESYRATVECILGDHPEGLEFRELVAAVRARQGHEVHRGSIRAVLSAGAFICRERRWCNSAGPGEGARRLRRLVAETLLPSADAQAAEARTTDPEHLRTLARTIRARLQEIIKPTRAQ